jgi:hypothetical protein
MWMCSYRTSEKLASSPGKDVSRRLLRFCATSCRFLSSTEALQERPHTPHHNALLQRREPFVPSMQLVRATASMLVFYTAGYETGQLIRPSHMETIRGDGPPQRTGEPLLSGTEKDSSRCSKHG